MRQLKREYFHSILQIECCCSNTRKQFALIEITKHKYGRYTNSNSMELKRIVTK